MSRGLGHSPLHGEAAAPDRVTNPIYVPGRRQFIGEQGDGYHEIDFGQRVTSAGPGALGQRLLEIRDLLIGEPSAEEGDQRNRGGGPCPRAWEREPQYPSVSPHAVIVASAIDAKAAKK